MTDEEVDYWTPFFEGNSDNPLEDAKKLYHSLIEGGVYTASLTEIIESTDY